MPAKPPSCPVMFCPPLTEHGHELGGLQVPVAPVGAVAAQRGVLLVVVSWLSPEGINDPDAAPGRGDRTTVTPRGPLFKKVPLPGISGVPRQIIPCLLPKHRVQEHPQQHFPNPCSLPKRAISPCRAFIFLMVLRMMYLLKTC